MTTSASLCFSSVSHSIGGSARLIWSSMWTGPFCPLRSCSMSVDALLAAARGAARTAAPCWDSVQPGIPLRRGDVVIDLVRFVAQQARSDQGAARIRIQRATRA